MLQHNMTYDTCPRAKPMAKAYEPNNNAFCNRVSSEAINNPCEPTMNKRLTGHANPRTLVQPTIAPPSHDITVWRTNPSINHSQINQKTPMNPALAGFGSPANSSGKDAGTPYCAGASIDYDVEIHSPFLNSLQPSIYTSTDVFQPINNNLGIASTPQFPNTTLETDIAGNEVFYDTNRSAESKEGWSAPRWAVEEKPFELLGRKPSKPHSLPEHVVDSAPDNNVVLHSHKPSFGEGPDAVYDPRFTGYGASDRSYTDELLGAPRFYYDDINAVRMPSYITRSKLDSCLTPFGDAYGKLNSGHLSLAEAREAAEASWVQNSMDYRTNLQKSLLRKRDEEMVQIRQAPKYTM